MSRFSIDEIMFFNPPESIKKGAVVKKIPMENLLPFTRKVNGYKKSIYSAGPKFRNGDTLLAKITPCLENGKTAYVDILDNDEIAFGSSEFIVLRAIDGISDSRFNYYLARSPAFREKAIKCMEGTSGRKRVNEKALKKQILPIPKIENQIRIASVLSSLDDKIELNNKINKELEAMAKTLYDYWFVQFDFPNENGKPYKSSGGKMVYDKELKKEIPQGWTVCALSDIANITMGQSPDGNSYNDQGNGIIFYQGATDFGSRFPQIRQYTTKPARLAKQGDILLSVRAPVGAINIANNDCCIGRGLAALNSKTNTITYLYEAIKTLKQIFDRRNIDGTTFGAISKDDLFSLNVVNPDDSILNNFHLFVYPMFIRMNILEQENQSLTSLRDFLLPMLMNGQVTVKTSKKAKK